MGTYLLVTNHYTNLQVVVKVNDRCPIRGVLDMTKLAVHMLGIKGSRKVEVQVLDPTEGYRRWAAQDTLAMSEEEYYAFRDRSAHKRITPYPLHPNESNKQKPVAKRTNTLTKPQPATTPNPTPDTASGPVIVQSQPAVVIAPNNVTSDTVDEHSIPLKDRRYDIELCIVNSHKAAMKEVNRLPKELQDKVTLEYNQRSRQVRIILTLADSRSRAVRTQSMISDDFPESYLILHKK